MPKKSQINKYSDKGFKDVFYPYDVAYDNLTMQHASSKLGE